MLITAYLWVVFFAQVKKVDIDLYENIRFSYWKLFERGYYNFVFKKGYLQYQDAQVKRYAHALYNVSYIGQWGFNLGMLTVLEVVLLRQLNFPIS